MGEATIELICSACSKGFIRAARHYRYNIKKFGDSYKPCCSTKCTHDLRFTQQEVDCAFCGNKVFKKQSEIKEGINLFCNSTCGAHYNNAKRKENGYYEDHPYINKLAICYMCKKEVEAHYAASLDKFCCLECRPEQRRIRDAASVKPHKCLLCDEIITKTRAKYCSTCLPIAQQNAGLKAASSRKDIRRSKNEIYLGELCETVYKNITYNEPMFEKWDSDIQLHDYNIAIHWNGPWHYQYCGGKHSVIQVQSRDKIKHDCIERCGWTNYIIKDMGKFNKEFVENEFEKLNKYIKELING